MKATALGLLMVLLLGCDGKEPEMGDICTVLGIMACGFDPATRTKIGLWCDGAAYLLEIDDCGECSHVIGSETAVACKKPGNTEYVTYAKKSQRCEKAGAGACTNDSKSVLTCSNGTWTVLQTCANKCGMTPNNAIGCI